MCLHKITDTYTFPHDLQYEQTKCILQPAPFPHTLHSIDLPVLALKKIPLNKLRPLPLRDIQGDIVQGSTNIQTMWQRNSIQSMSRALSFYCYILWLAELTTI
jgi:hypothetical protein